jgi:hypothetical protein
MASKAPAKHASVAVIGNLNKSTTVKKATTVASVWYLTSNSNNTEASYASKGLKIEEEAKKFAQILTDLFEEPLVLKVIQPKESAKAHLLGLEHIISTKAESYLEVGEQGKLHAHGLFRIVHESGSKFQLSYPLIRREICRALGLPKIHLFINKINANETNIRAYLQKNKLIREEEEVAPVVPADDWLQGDDNYIVIDTGDLRDETQSGDVANGEKMGAEKAGDIASNENAGDRHPAHTN